MTEFARRDEDMSRRERLRVANVRSVLHALAPKPVSEGVSLPSPVVASSGGFDATGMYHYAEEGGRWSDMGTYFEPSVDGADLGVVIPPSQPLRFNVDL